MSIKPNIPLPTLKRYNLYRQILIKNSNDWVSASVLERLTGIKSITIRKDINYLGVVGYPQKGFKKIELVNALKKISGLNNPKDIILVGRYGMGGALLENRDYLPSGFNIIACFDFVKSKEEESKIPIYSLEKMVDIIPRLGVDSIFISIKEEEVSYIKDIIISCGIEKILNLSPFFMTGNSNLKVVNYNLSTAIFDLLAM